jgi:oxygen-independent coproporphyrinogen-3 oxidase
MNTPLLVKKSFGVYFHIPYCIQRCTYCDFATYEQTQIMPPSSYTSLVLKEMDLRKHFYEPQALSTIYFGGGTPSLVNPQNILHMVEGLEKHGFARGPGTEMTLEINPATLSVEKMEAYLSIGFNRFSVGAQTFDDNLLKKVRREHTAAQTRDTLAFLKSYSVNYSFDLLFGLPGQTLEGLQRDLAVVLEFRPQHISPYCLTVPESNPLWLGRPSDDTQVDMFDLITKTLVDAGYSQYEISNFSLPGFESKHNSLYWQDEEWWGIGLSSHSYSKQTRWGVRYWNPRSIAEYEKQINSAEECFSPLELPESQFENLEKHQALTDFCHTSLRMMSGLDLHRLELKFDNLVLSRVVSICEKLENRGWLAKTPKGYALTQAGVVLSNQVFLELTFSAA